MKFRRYIKYIFIFIIAATVFCAEKHSIVSSNESDVCKVQTKNPKQPAEKSSSHAEDKGFIIIPKDGSEDNVIEDPAHESPNDYHDGEKIDYGMEEL